MYETSDLTRDKVKTKVISSSSKSDFVQEVIRRRMIREAGTEHFLPSVIDLALIDVSVLSTLILKKG